MSEKYEKSRFVRGTTDKNQRKSAIFHEGKSEISENQLSPARENKKSAKTGFPPRGKIKNQRKSAFPREGKQEIGENRLSPARENQKTPLAPFPTPQKNEKPRKFDKTTFGGQFTFYILSFGIYRPGNCYFLFFFSLEMTLYSEGDMP